MSNSARSSRLRRPRSKRNPLRRLFSRQLDLNDQSSDDEDCYRQLQTQQQSQQAHQSQPYPQPPEQPQKQDDKPIHFNKEKDRENNDVEISVPPPHKLTDLNAGGAIALDFLIRKLQHIEKQRNNNSDDGNTNTIDNSEEHSYHKNSGLTQENQNGTSKSRKHQSRKSRRSGDDHGSYGTADNDIRRTLREKGRSKSVDERRRRRPLLKQLFKNSNIPNSTQSQNTSQHRGDNPSISIFNNANNPLSEEARNKRRPQVSEQQDKSGSSSTCRTPKRMVRPDKNNNLRGIISSVSKSELENRELRERLEQLEVTVVENQTLKQQVKQLEWALDVVRDDAERVRIDAWNLLTERDQQQQHDNNNGRPKKKERFFKNRHGNLRDGSIDPTLQQKSMTNTTTNTTTTTRRNETRETSRNVPRSGVTALKDTTSSSKMPSPTSVRDCAAVHYGIEDEVSTRCRRSKSSSLARFGFTKSTVGEITDKHTEQEE